MSGRGVRRRSDFVAATGGEVAQVYDSRRSPVTGRRYCGSI